MLSYTNIDLGKNNCDFKTVDHLCGSECFTNAFSNHLATDSRHRIHVLSDNICISNTSENLTPMINLLIVIRWTAKTPTSIIYIADGT